MEIAATSSCLFSKNESSIRIVLSQECIRLGYIKEPGAFSLGTESDREK